MRQHHCDLHSFEAFVISNEMVCSRNYVWYAIFSNERGILGGRGGVY